jgi:hypothetical protein
MNPDTGHGLTMHVDAQGVLGLDVRAWGDAARFGSGTDMILSGMERLRADGVQVTAIRGEWFSSTQSRNFQEFMASRSALGDRQAAANTWTGRLAARLGYTQVSQPMVSSSRVRVLFTRPTNGH